MLWRAITGDAKLLISHLSDDDLSRPDIGKTIRNLLADAYRYISEFEDQEDFDHAVYGLVRGREQSLLQFAQVAQSAFLKADQHGDPLSDRRKGMIFLKRAKIPPHLEDHIMARTGGEKSFTALFDAIKILNRRPQTISGSTYWEAGDEEEDVYWDDDDPETYEEDQSEFEDYYPEEDDVY